MKKVFIFLAMMLVCFASFAQESEQDKTESKTLEFMSKDGTLLTKEFYAMPKVKGINECQVLIITDVVKNHKIGCLRLTVKYSGYSTTRSYIGTLDSDEIDACIQSINYIKDNLLPTTPEVYTEVMYTTRDKVEIGAYFNETKNSWTAFLQTKSYTTDSMAFFSADELQNLVSVLQQAKQLIAEKTK